MRQGLIAAREIFDGGYEASFEDQGWRISCPIERVARAIATETTSGNPIQAAEVQHGLGKLRIEPGILDAFLEVLAYYHGSWSMEPIVEMSALFGSLRYERSFLSAVNQTALNADAGAFMTLVDQRGQ